MWRSIRRHARRTLETFAPGCVLSYWLHPDGEVALRAARSLGVPGAIIVGGSDALLLPRDPARRRSIVRVLEEADALITVSQGLRDKLIELGARPEKVHAIYQGIDRDLFCPGDRAAARRRLGLPAGQKALVWVGGMVAVKGLDVLLDACARLRSGGTDFHLYLIGDGPLRHRLASRTAAEGLSGTVTFVGSLTPGRLPDWYRAADLTVLSSWSEGIPNVLRESLACGTPFVATRVGDVAEFCPEASGELVPPGDAPALAEAIRHALAGHGVRPALSPASWDEYAQTVADLLQGLVRPGAAQLVGAGAPGT
jgi:glycosyltransferase involved in cell wall biosynthesis